MPVKTVKIGRKYVRDKYGERYSYQVSLPKELMRVAGILKEESGREELVTQYLIATVIEINTSGGRRRAIIFYPP